MKSDEICADLKPSAVFSYSINSNSSCLHNRSEISNMKNLVLEIVDEVPK